MGGRANAGKTVGTNDDACSAAAATLSSVRKLHLRDPVSFLRYARLPREDLEGALARAGARVGDRIVLLSRRTRLSLKGANTKKNRPDASLPKYHLLDLGAADRVGATNKKSTRERVLQYTTKQIDQSLRGRAH